jgi:4-hydroxy-4-methyl-2-oxoglutarate aldolase
MTASSPSSAAEIGAALAALGAATLGESGGRAMRSRLRAAWRDCELAAPAYPVRCSPGDNLAVHVAVTTAPSGCVLVVDVGDVSELGYWGEVLTTAAESRGIVGLVIDGGVRDVAALEAHGFPVFSTDIALRGATKQEPGVVGETAVVGGVEVGPGDWIVGDRDGVTVIPAATLDAILASGRERATKEDRMFSELRGGKTTVELLSLDPGAIRVGGEEAT